MKDVLLVGLGLAGIAMCERLLAEGKTFDVYENGSQTSSKVAGGLYNPVILKRFTLAWNADIQLAQAVPFYQAIEEKLNIAIDDKLKVLRRFASIEEQNLWFEAADRPRLKQLLNNQIHKNRNEGIAADKGFGEVLKTGKIDTANLQQAYTSYLEGLNCISRATFDYNALQIKADAFEFKGTIYKKIIFAEGFGLKKNPFFNYLPLNGTKGELLTIKAPNLKEESVIKSSCFIIPLGGDYYRVGATYKWKDKTNTPTEAAKEELITKLRTFLTSEFEVVDHVAGIRPTVTDRRPLVGSHPKFNNMYVLNGFGSRGVLLAPYASQQLFDFIYKQSSLNPEIDIARFSEKYFVN